MVTETLTPELQAEKLRDMRGQLGVGQSELQEVVFADTSTRTRKARLYRIKDGWPVEVPMPLLERTLAKRDRKSGAFLFTADKSSAAKYKPGTRPCFLHPDAPEQPMLEEIGLGMATCRKNNLRSDYARRLHAQNRHSSEWALFQEAKSKIENDEWRAQSRAQIEATLELARAAAGQAESAPAPRGKKD